MINDLLKQIRVLWIIIFIQLGLITTKVTYDFLDHVGDDNTRQKPWFKITPCPGYELSFDRQFTWGPQSSISWSGDIINSDSSVDVIGKFYMRKKK